MNSSPCRRQRVFTLVERANVLVIFGIIAGTPAANFASAAQRRYIEGTAAQSRTNTLHMRSLAVARKQSPRMSFVDTPGGTCHVMQMGAANICQCHSQGAARCTGSPQALRDVACPTVEPVAARSKSRSILIDATQGKDTPTATLQVQGRGGRTLEVNVNSMDRARTRAASAGPPGFTAC